MTRSNGIVVRGIIGPATGDQIRCQDLETRVPTAIITERAGPTTTIWLDGQGRPNALGSAAWSRLPHAFAEAEADPATRVIILRGRGGNFGVGADIKEFDRVFASSETTLRYFAEMEAAMVGLEAVAKPTIAAIEGLCIGACVALALACDIRIAAASSNFAITPAKLGLAYPYGDIRRVIAAVGANRTKALMFSGQAITADTALTYGLVERVIEGEFEVGLKDASSAIVSCSPWTISATKRAIAAALVGAKAEQANYPQILVQAVQGSDFQEGMSAFANGRSPIFAG